MAEESARRTRVILALGSNIAPRLKYLQAALAALEAAPRVAVRKRSRIYESQSVEGGGEGDFLNAALEIETSLSARELLALCQSIEAACNRQAPEVGEHRHGARTLDVDIVSFGDENSCARELLLPHPRALWRSFVLRPVLDLLGESGRESGGWVRESGLDWEESSEE